VWGSDLKEETMRIRLIAISSALLLGLAFVGHDAIAESRSGGGGGGMSSGGGMSGPSTGGGGMSGSQGGGQSGMGAQSGMSGSRNTASARDKSRQKQARARKSGDIVCTGYGWCRPMPCPAGKQADGTCW
jgi:hypothetical protein